MTLGVWASSVEAAELPERGSARYWLFDGGERRGHETLEWVIKEDSYRLERLRERHQHPAIETHDGDRRLQRTREISQGTVEDQTLQPETYEVRTATAFQDADAYDPETAFEDIEEETTLRVRFTGNEGELEGEEIAVPPDTLDPLAHLWQLMGKTLSGDRHQEIAHRVVSQDGKVQEVTFQIEGRRTVRSEAGTFRTVRLIRRLPGQQRAIRWYMAKGWEGLLVRAVDRRSERPVQRRRLERIEAIRAEG